MGQLPDKPSGSWVKRLRTEVSGWKEEGLISSGQAEEILLRYKSSEEEHGGRLVTVLAVIGALLLGTGVILFFAANWQAIPKWVKVSVIMGSIITAYGVGYYLSFEKGSYPRVGRSLLFLGSILYGAGIWLVAQIFHISSHFPNGFLFWALGIIPIIVVCGSLSILLEASILIIIWTFMEQSGFLNTNWLFLPLGSAVLYLGYRLKSPLAVGLTLPGFAVWLAASAAISLKGGEIRTFLFTVLLMLPLGMAVYAAGCYQSQVERFMSMKTPYKIVGLLLAFGALFLASFRFIVHESMYRQSEFTFSLFYIISFILMAGLAVLLAGLTISKIRSNQGGVTEAIFQVIMIAVAAAVTISLTVLGEAVFVVITNIVLFSAIIAVIVIGYRSREPVLVNVGLVFFVLDVIARYFDFFWDMLDKSVFFMIGGVLLILGGTILERNRRKVLQEMKVNDYAA